MKNLVKMMLVGLLCMGFVGCEDRDSASDDAGSTTMESSEMSESSDMPDSEPAAEDESAEEEEHPEFQFQYGTKFLFVEHCPYKKELGTCFSDKKRLFFERYSRRSLRRQC